ncbi:MAG: hypothetical protein JWO62_2268 [Acidimicrobiaceae bacterium]|nr:hypothetical protein [Acidimicrobiaceae bacterium]
MSPTAPSSPDTWLNVVTGIGALAGGTAAVLGGALATLYGRRASVSISALVHRTAAGFVISTRPVIKAVGLWRVKFHESKGVLVRMTEVYVGDDGSLLETDDPQEHSRAFNQQYVDPGEELTTSVTFPPTNPSPSVIGWQVYLKVTAPTRLAKFRSGWWMDQVFVPRPDTKEV